LEEEDNERTPRALSVAIRGNTTGRSAIWVSCSTTATTTTTMSAFAQR
jgi:hypothetical protein